MTNVFDLTDLEIEAVVGGKKWWEYFYDEDDGTDECACTKG